jgi:CubicO group peptidase (beta-lactamase class C family)
MTALRWFSLFVLAACGSPATDAQVRVRPSLPAAASTAGPARDPVESIARVERGLIPEVRVAGERGWTIEDRLRAHHTPGVSLAVIHDYRVVWAKSYGVADVATEMPLTPGTLMQAASVSKMVTAMAVLRAVDAGRVSLDADIDAALHSWHPTYDAAAGATRVTLKHLLSHTAGVNVDGFPGYAEDEVLPTLVQVLDGKPPANTPPVRVTAAPGGAFRYSGGGTTIVQQLLVDLDGRPFAALMDAAVLVPLGLAHSTFEQPPAHERFPVLAIGHDYDGSVASGGRTRYAEAAAGGLWTTAGDLARFVAEIQLGLEGRSAVVSRELATRMTTPVASIGGGTSVALGTFVERHGSTPYFGHDGLGQGFLTMLRASKTKGEGAVVMANGFAAAPLLLEILRSVAAEYGWDGWLAPPAVLARVDAEHLRTFEGRYASGPDQSITIVAKGDRLEVRQPFHAPIDLLPVGVDAFLECAEGTRFEFQRGAAGVERLVKTPAPWPPRGSPVTLARTNETSIEPLLLLEAGRYDEALAAYAKRLKADPKDPVVDAPRFNALAEDLLDRQLDPEKALLVLRLDVALYPESSMARVDLAEAQRRLALRADSVASAAKAQALFPRDQTLGEFDRIVFQWKMGKLRRRGVDAKSGLSPASR